jgi:transcriptional regulator with XRE-family HTH domain
MDASSLSRIETKNSPNVSFEKIYELSRYYNVSLDKLVSGDIEEENFIEEEPDKIVVSKNELPYYRVVQEAKSEGLSPEETKFIIKLFRKITGEIQGRNIADEYMKTAYMAKSQGVSESKFKNMVEYLIKNEELAD